jgi:two-component system, NtrC family, nitrogen regulation response regulator NtrX
MSDSRPAKSVLYLGCPTAERADTEKLLGAASVSIVWADNVHGAISELQRKNLPVLLDLSRGAAALQVAREIRAHRASAIMFAVVDARRPDLTIEAVLAGMADVFARPLAGRRVVNAIQRELSYEAGQAGPQTGACGPNGQNIGPTDPLADDLYGHSPAMRDVLALIARAATMRAGVMIRGEEGTGRQAAARAIHAAQNGGAGAFVTVNCAAYDSDQLDTALFGPSAGNIHKVDAIGDGGHSRGLERVAKNSRLHDARNGTLYLQNVAEASTRVQARLARVLRDREAIMCDDAGHAGQFGRAGRDAVSFDVRPMTGVDPGFDIAVQDGRVRDDLYRRLSVIRIEMPPLRNRREDIPALANCFLRAICAASGVPPKTLSRSALALIAALPWRGNAIELRALLEGIVGGLQGGKNIGLEDVLSHVRLDGGSAVFANGGTLKQARARFEREYIAAVLEQHRGRISEAARALGIQRTNLYRKLRALRVGRK